MFSVRLDLSSLRTSEPQNLSLRLSSLANTGWFVIVSDWSQEGTGAVEYDVVRWIATKLPILCLHVLSAAVHPAIIGFEIEYDLK